MRRIIVIAQSQIMAREWMHRSGIDVSRCKIITSLRGIEPVLGYSDYDYVLLGEWDFFLTKQEYLAFWKNVSNPDVGARQLSPETGNPLQ